MCGMFGKLENNNLYKVGPWEKSLSPILIFEMSKFSVQLTGICNLKSLMNKL
jgi:hypothetical protein